MFSLKVKILKIDLYEFIDFPFSVLFIERAYLLAFRMILDHYQDRSDNDLVTQQFEGKFPLHFELFNPKRI